MASLQPLSAALATAPQSRSGRVAPGLAIALVAFALLAVGLWLGRGGSPAEAPRPEAAALPGVDVESDLLLDNGRLAAATAERLAPAASASGDAQAPVGVRLAGPGRLAGRVVEVLEAVASAPGAEAQDPLAAPVWREVPAGCRVELFGVPPAGIDFLTNAVALGRFDESFAARMRPVAVAETAAGGAFEFESVRSGTYFLRAFSATLCSRAPVTVWVDAAGRGGPVDVPVAAAGSLVGRVVAPAGQSAAGGRVALYRGLGSAISATRAGDRTYYETAVDSGGRFLFDGLAPGNGYDLSLFAGGLAVTHALDLEVRAGETTEVLLKPGLAASLTGRVLGREGDVARPLAGARVGAVPRGLRDLTFAEEILRNSSAVTDADGHYRLDGLPPGEVDLLAIGARHLPGHLGRVAAVPGAVGTADDLVLQAGLELHARIVDEAGEPLAGVELRFELFEPDDVRFEFSFAPWLYQAVERYDFPESDAEGRVVAGPMPINDTLELVAYRPGLPWRELEVALDAALAGEVTLTVPHGGAVSGIAIDRTRGEPVAAFTIDTPARADETAGEPGAWNPFSGGIAFDDGTGAFRLGGLRSGAVSMMFEAPGFLPRQVTAQITAGGVTEGLIVELARGAGVAGRVLDPDGRPVLGARVLAERDGRLAQGRRPDILRAPVPMADEWNFLLDAAPLDLAAGVGLLGNAGAATDAEGRFELTGIKPGRVGLIALHPDHPQLSGPTLELEADLVESGVELRFERGASLSGLVTDRFDDPLAGATVFAFAPPGTQALGAMALASGLSDPEGHYRIAPLDPGTYFVGVTRADAQLSPVSILGRLSTDLVTVPAGEDVEMDLVDRSSGGARVFGRVLRQGQPVSGGALFATDLDSDSLLGVDFKFAEVDRLGRYEFPGLAPADYLFTYQDGSVRVRMDVEVPEQREFPFDVELPGGRIAGRVVAAADGRPVSLARVQLSVDRGSSGGLLGLGFMQQVSSESVGTIEDGRFAFELLEAGRYRLSARLRGEAKALGRSAELELELEGGASIEDVVLELPAALSVSGRVSGPDGPPSEDALVEGFVGGTRAAYTWTDDQGAFRLDGLTPDTALQLVASLDGDAESAPLALQLEQASIEGVELQLELGVQLSLCCTGSDGGPAAGAVASLTRLDVERQQTGDVDDLFRGRGVAGPDGCVDLGVLPVGRYRIQVGRGQERAGIEDFALESGPPERRVELQLERP